MSDAFAFDYVSCKRPSSTEPTMEPWHTWAFTAAAGSGFRLLPEFSRP